MSTIGTPEWAMVGWQAEGFHWLLASRTLESATLDWVRREYRFESWQAFTAPGAFRPAWHVDIVGTGGRDGFILVRGSSYAECLADLLFKHGWRADGDPLELREHDPILRSLEARVMIEGTVVDD